MKRLGMPASFRGRSFQAWQIAATFSALDLAVGSARVRVDVDPEVARVRRRARRNRSRFSAEMPPASRNGRVEPLGERRDDARRRASAPVLPTRPSVAHRVEEEDVDARLLVRRRSAAPRCSRPPRTCRTLSTRTSGAMLLHRAHEARASGSRAAGPSARPMPSSASRSASTSFRNVTSTGARLPVAAAAAPKLAARCPAAGRPARPARRTRGRRSRPCWLASRSISAGSVMPHTLTRAPSSALASRSSRSVMSATGGLGTRDSAHR